MTIYNLHQFTDAPIGAHDLMGAAQFIMIPPPPTSPLGALTMGFGLRLAAKPFVQKMHPVEATAWLIAGVIAAGLEDYRRR